MKVIRGDLRRPIWTFVKIFVQILSFPLLDIVPFVWYNMYSKSDEIEIVQSYRSYLTYKFGCEYES